MTFSPIIPRTLRRTDPVCAALQHRSNNGKRRVYFEVTLSANLCADLKWKVGDRIEVAAGEGPDHGYVRLKPSLDGYVLKMPGNTSARPRLTMNYWGPETKFAQAPCEAKVDVIGRTLTIELPWQRRIRAVA